MIDPNQLDGPIQKSSGGADNRSTVSGGSGGTASAASATASAANTPAGKQRIVANNVGNIRTTNERFQYLFKEGIKHFRIP